MNKGTVTGGVVKDAVKAFTRDAAPRAQFTIAVSDSHRQSSFWNCEVEDPALIETCLAQARPGVGVLLEFELATKPFEKHGVRVGEIRFLRVTRAEFHNRHAPAEASP